MDTSRLMVMFYSSTSLMNHLWEDVTVIIWGAPVKLVSENEAIQEEMKLAQHAGVKFSACMSCARRFGAVEKLQGLGVEAVPWVEPFTDLIKSGKKIIYV